MTVEEIKQQVTMQDVLSRYGLSAKRGMLKCPFHGKDKHPSMKIYGDGYKCFTCNKHGDIFSFVMEMENCDFKNAFLSLGGNYQHKNENARMVANMRFQMAKDRKFGAENTNKYKWQQWSKFIKEQKQIIDNSEVFSDEQAAAIHKLEYAFYIMDVYLRGGDIPWINNQS